MELCLGVDKVRSSEPSLQGCSWPGCFTCMTLLFGVTTVMVSLCFFSPCSTRAAAWTQKHTDRKGSTMTLPHPRQHLPSHHPLRINGWPCFCGCCLQPAETLFLSSLPVFVIVTLSLQRLTHRFPSFPGLPVWYRWRFKCRPCWRVGSPTSSFCL